MRAGWLVLGWVAGQLVLDSNVFWWENIWRPRIKDFEETFTGLLLEEEEKRKTYSWIDIGRETLLRHQFHRDITISQKMHSKGRMPLFK